MVCNLQICMSKEMKLYTQSLDLPYLKCKPTVTSPLYNAAWCWRWPCSPRGSGFQCTAQANAMQTAAPEQSTAQSVPALALAMLCAHSSQHRSLFPPADKAGFPRAAATALFPCCFHALLILFSHGLVPAAMTGHGGCS